MELEISDLTKKFGDFTAVDHLNITMQNGVYGLLGVNGAVIAFVDVFYGVISISTSRSFKVFHQCIHKIREIE